MLVEIIASKNISISFIRIRVLLIAGELVALLPTTGTLQLKVDFKATGLFLKLLINSK